MSFKLTELTESSPSSLPPSVLCGSGILSRLASPWSMASSGHFDPSQTYDGYKVVEVLHPAYTKLTSCSRQRYVAWWTDFGGPITVGGSPIYSSSEVPISRINTEGVVKRIRQIAYSAPDPDAEVSDELDSEEIEVVHNSICHKSSPSPSHPPFKRFQIHIIPSTPRTFQPALATIPTSLPPPGLP
ncbi:hypothetical protein O181_021235 [Austropuccinia psidii MF-1]|uniref:Uncharacterized protein n=1 Tax=Austropuccinia psidii MF-1 TaxID=1389203 RepID=A0A9Q3CE93_9BASI|nr:hypothetical protein [Austropuccinia psidii MF-1]